MRLEVVFFSLFLSSALLAQQPPTPEAKPARLMLWHMIPAEGATPALTGRIERKIRALLAGKLPGGLLDEMVMDSVLLVEGNEKFLRCGLGSVCLAGLGRAAGVERVAAGEVAQESGRLAIRLVLVDSPSGKTLGEARVGGFGELGPSTLEEITVALLEPERYRGTLELSGGVPGAEVRLDEKRLGVMPLIGPLQDLVAGEHSLEVRKSGYLPFQQKVHIPFGRKQKVEVKLVMVRPPQRRFWENWLFWTAAGVGAVSAAIGGGLYYDAGVLRDNARQCELAGLDCDDDYNRKADSRTVQALVMFGIGGAGLVTAAVVAVIDLASGEEEPLIPRTVSFVPLRDGGVMSLDLRF